MQAISIKVKSASTKISTLVAQFWILSQDQLNKTYQQILKSLSKLVPKTTQSFQRDNPYLKKEHSRCRLKWRR